ncbi:MAG: hypothetical protein ACLVDP_06240 [Flavonifractor plautii]
MVQHIGKPCTPLVKAGEPVKLGQKIGDAEGLSATIHASVSGTVAAVEPRPHPSGRAVLSVVIDNDYQDTPPKHWSLTPPTRGSPPTIFSPSSGRRASSAWAAPPSPPTSRLSPPRGGWTLSW